MLFCSLNLLLFDVPVAVAVAAVPVAVPVAVAVAVVSLLGTLYPRTATAAKTSLKK